MELHLEVLVRPQIALRLCRPDASVARGWAGSSGGTGSGSNWGTALAAGGMGLGLGLLLSNRNSNTTVPR